MDIESIREYCLSLPLATEAFPFDERTLAFRIFDKIFACVDLERPEWVTMKCNADYALELREEHSEIEGAWHWNKKYWNQVNLYGGLEDDFIQSLLRHSYSEVVKKLKKQEKLSILKSWRWWSSFYHSTLSLRITPSVASSAVKVSPLYCTQSITSGSVPLLRTERLPAGATLTTLPS